MQDFEVTPQFLNETGGKCHSTADLIQGQLGDLRTFVVSLREVWEGPASLSFEDVMRTWDTHATNLNIALEGIGNGLYANAGNFVEGEIDNVKNLDQVHADIPPARL